jgi:uncharacterized LabA/DUF88 family protein
MSFPLRYATLLDGGFVIKKLQQAHHHFPTAEEVEQLCTATAAHTHLASYELLRNYFYHATPARDVLTNPLDGSKMDLAATPIHAQHLSLLDRLEMKPNFSVRLGETMTHEWRLGSSAMKSLSKASRPIQANDLVPNIMQKGVDLRIGLDIARLALRDMVRIIVVFTGDSDLVPAFKFARREGIKIYLNTLGHGVRRELKAHADILL